MVTVDTVDAASFGRLSSRYGVMALPTTVVNDEERMVGAAPEPQLMETIRRALAKGA
jgi:predicted DsbA family dithiol-disulfide isomerase